ncbi:hypothetical protein CHLRE_06g304600v5 [Chlamydomonas reinhardtii]|uniref:Rhodanese domain-containing protein n=1 Tax=Chlamydomonas reinhardtii TaxID=3055 RepID=A0A2K3DR88_CHLRE|nr:uncharacterized protein CHLRE_06g304600v5 [Chlamydomonas reinhardtii]PNW83046.1 hypothetical protein CHLRE_06g304600v5 [Chlamydomonas reinhardtii]
MLKLYSSQLVPHTKGLQRAQPVPVSVLAVHSTHANVAPTAPRVASEWRHTQSRLLCRSAAPSTGGATSPAGTSSVPPQLVPPTDPNSYCVLNFYHLTPVENPQEATEEHRRFIERMGLDIRGRIYISSQGMNCQYGGTLEHCTAYVEWVKQQPGFQNLRYTVWPSPEGHAFPKLRLKYKPNLISLAGGMEAMPITDPAARATPLEPAAWRDMIAQAEEKKVVVLDVRNDYEWDAGHFVGADRPAEEVFAETPVGESEAEVPQPLQGKDPNTPVMMYCTGGIRCDVYSTFLRRKGFNNLYTLEGGVQNYLRQEGGDHWKGSLFVFDGRMAISANKDGDEGGPLPAAVPCQVCGSPASQLPHVNCANIDCNELFIACAPCKAKLQGCCCAECMTAPRLLRPAKVDGGQYGAWGNYADRDEVGPVISTGRNREGRVARRARRRAALKEKRLGQIEEKLSRKKMVREAMARVEEVEAAQREKGVEQGPRIACSQ